MGEEWEQAVSGGDAVAAAGVKKNKMNGRRFTDRKV